MDYLLKWLLLASVQTAATISPGPAFAMTLKNAVAYDRTTGLMSSIGLGLGVGAHILFVLLGFSVLITQSVMLFNIVKYAGAAYLMFIGVKALMAKKQKAADNTIDLKETQKAQSMDKLSAIWQGFLTNLLNPKAVVFFTAVYAQFITPGTPYEILALYGLTSILIEMGWFSCVTLFLTTPYIRQRFLAITHWIERTCGALLIGLGVKLALTKAT